MIHGPASRQAGDTDGTDWISGDLKMNFKLRATLGDSAVHSLRTPHHENAKGFATLSEIHCGGTQSHAELFADAHGRSRENAKGFAGAHGVARKSTKAQSSSRCSEY